jgi:hypothetical protein
MKLIRAAKIYERKGIAKDFFDRINRIHRMHRMGRNLDRERQERE